MRSQRTTIDDVVDHIDYIVELVGIDHVGLGLDQVERDALGSGHSEADIRKILGENFLRVYKQIIG